MDTAFRAASKGRAQGVLTLHSAIFASQRAQIAEVAVKERLPSCTIRAKFVEAGGLLFYGVTVPDLKTLLLRADQVTE